MSYRRVSRLGQSSTSGYRGLIIACCELLPCLEAGAAINVRLLSSSDPVPAIGGVQHERKGNAARPKAASSLKPHLHLAMMDPPGSVDTCPTRPHCTCPHCQASCTAANSTPLATFTSRPLAEPANGVIWGMAPGPAVLGMTSPHPF